MSSMQIEEGEVREKSPEVFRPDDVEQYRNNSELPHYWEVRKEFLLAHHEKFPLDRLIALSNCYINIEYLGVTYHNDVMELIKELKTVLTKPQEIAQTQPTTTSDSEPANYSSEMEQTSSYYSGIESDWRDRSNQQPARQPHFNQSWTSREPNLEESRQFTTRGVARGRSRHPRFQNTYEPRPVPGPSFSAPQRYYNPNQGYQQPRFQQRSYNPRQRYQNLQPQQQQQQQQYEYQPHSSFFSQHRGPRRF